MNKKQMFVLNPEAVRMAKAIYKKGAFYNASKSAFIRDVMEEIIKLVKRG